MSLSKAMLKIFLAMVLINCQLYSVNTKNASDFLENQRQILESYYKTLKQQSLKKQYPIFRGRKVIEHSVYLKSSNEIQDSLKGQIVMTHFILKNFIKYSNLGGVGVAGILASDFEDKKARVFYLGFDGRYLSDLEFLGINADLYAYCVLPEFNKCILLGIGEDWQ